MVTSQNPKHHITEYLPYVADWLTEIGRTVDEVETLHVNPNTTRNEAKEIATGSQWQIWEVGAEITVTVTFADKSSQVKSFNRHVVQPKGQP